MLRLTCIIYSILAKYTQKKTTNHFRAGRSSKFIKTAQQKISHRVKKQSHDGAHASLRTSNF